MGVGLVNKSLEVANFYCLSTVNCVFYYRIQLDGVLSQLG